MARGAGHPGDGPGIATPEAYVPHMMDLEYTPEEGPDSFPEPGWAEETPEVGVFHELPTGFADSFSDNDRRVQPISREHTYANHGPQVNQATVAAGDPRVVAPLPAGVAH